MFKKILFEKSLSFKILALSLALGAIGFLYSSYQVYAANIFAGVLQIEYEGSGALFNEANIAPGFSTTKIVKVTNTGQVPHSFSIAVDKTLGPLADVLRIKARYDGADVWDKTIAEIAKYDQSEPIIGSLSPGASKDVELTAYLPESVGNSYMGTSTFAFDFVMGNESTDQPEPSSNPSPPVTFGTSGSAGVAGQGTVGGVAGEGAETNDQNATGENDDNILGTSDEGTKGAATTARDLCFWWIVILIILVAFLMIYHRYIKEERPAFWWLWPVVMAAVLFFVQMIFDRYYEPTVFCRWFWALEAGVLVIYYIYENYSEAKKGGK